MGWLPAIDDYEVSLVDGAIVCRKDGGKALRSMPKAVKESDAVASLRSVQEWLRRHEDRCLRTVETWLLRSLPVPAAVLAAVWPDDAWRRLLTDAVVAPVGDSGDWQVAAGGLLRAVDPDGRLGVVNLDGETVRLAVDRVVVPHPVLLPDLADLREFAVELGVTQGLAQLFRETWARPEDPSRRRDALAQFAGGHFAQLRHLTSRAVSLGFGVRGGYATLRVFQDGRVLDARVWIGDGDPAIQTQTGELEFVDLSGSRVGTEDVDPVAWSEGLRMAAGLYAGRVVPTGAGP
jgi:hypothetical protein